MSILLDLSSAHKVVAAASHYYKTPTEKLYLDRVLPFHDIVYLVSGSWLFTENDIEYPMEPGDILLLSAGRRHYTRLPSAPETRTICIHVSCEEMDGQVGEHSVELPTLMHIHDKSGVPALLEEIVNAFWVNSPCKELKMASLLNLVFCELVAQQSIRDEASSQRSNLVILNRINQLINENTHQFLRLDDVSQRLFVSKKTIENALKKCANETFSAYQMNHKLEMVALQLRTEPYVSLREIASNYGFCDEFYMSKVFKKKYQMSPKEYRSSQSI